MVDMRTSGTRKESEVTEPQTTAQQLGSIIKSARDIMRKDKGLNGDLDRLPMLTWIMFLKFLDDLEGARKTQAELKGMTFARRSNRHTAGGTGRPKKAASPGAELIAFVNNDEAVRPDGTRGAGLFAYLREPAGRQRRRPPRRNRTVFSGIQNRMQNGYLLRDVINKVNSIHFNASEELHTLGRLYESMLTEMRDSAGDSGEFYTPRPVVRFMVEVTNPIGRDGARPRVRHRRLPRRGVRAPREAVQDCRGSEDASERGQHLRRRAKAAAVSASAQMNLLLHGLENPKIDPGNSLRFHARRNRRQGPGRHHPHQSTVRRGGGEGDSRKFPGG